MRTFSDMRLECLKLASTLANAKVINPNDVIPRAMEYMRWVDEGDAEKVTPEKLKQVAEHFRRANL